MAAIKISQLTGVTSPSITGVTIYDDGITTYKISLQDIGNLIGGSISGSTGSSGTSGHNGSSGTSGTSGIGISGTDGTSGTSGTSGTDGTNGTDGYTPQFQVDYFNGADGSSGSNGTSGTSGTGGIPYSSGYVNVGTYVQLDNIKATVPTSGSKGLSLGAVSTNFTANISGHYVQAGGAFTGDSSINVSYTTTAANSAFGWNFGGEGDTSTYILNDKTNLRTYRVILMIGSGYVNNFISIERLY